MSITYRVGDATQPEERPAIIAHICNDIGAWGAGFVKAISARWPEPEEDYRAWFAGETGPFAKPFELGRMRMILVEPKEGLWVANIIGQHGLKSRVNPSPVHYPSVLKGLQAVSRSASYRGASIHMPKIGCGLGGGRWEVMSGVVMGALKGLDVFVYDLPLKEGV